MIKKGLALRRTFFFNMYILNKPDSVTDKSAFIIYLVRSMRIYLPTPFDIRVSVYRRVTYPSKKKDQNIHGIATHKVYPFRILLFYSVSSYLTFSPLPRHKCLGGLAFCDTIYL